MRLAFTSKWCKWAVFTSVLVTLTGCGDRPTPVQPRAFQIQQQWQLEPGSVVAGRRISGGLGDISIDLDGGTVHAPFEGELQPFQADCVVFSSPELPAYLLRLCGLQAPNLGKRREGQSLGSGHTLHFAALRKQPSGQWALVEPSKAILERILTKP
ncbi:MAG: hypothetical protein VKK04_05785 [Synechococcales bacterium]|nr:hypothetical protein [Synechococcales bacterium]